MVQPRAAWLLFLVIFCSISCILSVKLITTPSLGGGQVKCLIKSQKLNKGEGSKEVINCFGIPYAKPPINELRFKHPVEWDKPFKAGTIFDATTKKDGCMQSPDGDTGKYSGFDSPQWNGAEMSENCLNLNIFRPNNDDKLPVMVWIHGGNFRWGYSAAGFYDGSSLSTKDVMIITVNYRLDVFGSLYIGGSKHIKGNQAYMDNKMALKWIQKHIIDFGGDRNAVTIFGESAGGQFVISLTGDPSTAEPIKLFHRGIAQSAPIGIPYRTPQTWSNIVDSFGKLAGCYTVEIKVHRAIDIKGGKDTKSKPDPHIEIIGWMTNPDTKKQYKYEIGMTPWKKNTRDPVWTEHNVFASCHYIDAIQFVVYDKHSSDEAAVNKGPELSRSPKIVIDKNQYVYDKTTTRLLGFKGLSIGKLRLGGHGEKGKLQYSYKFSKEKIEDCLQRKGSKDIGRASWTIVPSLTSGEKTGVFNGFEQWTPTVDGKIIRFQPNSLIRYKRLRKDVPLIMGNTEDEASLFVYAVLPHPIKHGKWLKTLDVFRITRMMKEICIEEFNAYFACGEHTEFCKPQLTYNCIMLALLGDTIQKDMFKLIFGGGEKVEHFKCKDNDCRKHIDKVIEHILFNNPLWMAGHRYPNMYLYQFDVAGAYAHSSDAQSNPFFPVVTREACVNQEASCHASELPYVFHSKLETLKIKDPKFNKYSQNELLLIDDIQTYWTNFAKTGHPKEGWKPFGVEKKRFGKKKHKIMRFYYRQYKEQENKDEYTHELVDIEILPDFKNCKWWDNKIGDPWWIKFGQP